ncbi:MAG: hypothetical protein ABIL58_21290 [Pseudomonadota bacterium]
MIKKIIFRAAAALVILGLAGAAGFFGYERHRQQKALAESTRSLDTSERRNKALQRKIAEDNAKGVVLLRSKLAVDQENTLLKEDLAAALDNNSALIAALEEEKSKKGLTVAGLEKKIKTLNDDNDALSAAILEIKGRLADADATIKEKDEKIESLETRQSDLAARLGDAEQGLDRCIGNNRKLSQLAGELVEKYKGKTLGETLAETEPFTQIQRVELEHLIQEYQESIDDETITDRNRS